MYMVLGIEVFNYAEIKGIFANKKQAEELAEYLEQKKNIHCCQRYKVKTKTQVKKEKIKLY